MDSIRLNYRKLLWMTIILIPIILNIMSRSNVKYIASNSMKSPKKYETTYPPRIKRLPQAIIIGANKAGTGALRNMMKMHSKIVAPGNEIHFFDDYYNRGIEWYREQMPSSSPGQITLEKTPSYFRIENISIPLRIHSMNSSIRLILIVRDPVTRTISNYVQNMEIGSRNPVSFEEACMHSDGTVKYEKREISNSLYAPKFKLYLEVFRREQILVLNGDQMIRDPLPIIQRVERFLNLEPEITKENLYFSKEKGFYCMKINGIESCLGKQKGREHPEVNKEVLRKLRVYFAPYNQRFYDLVGHDFGWATS